MRSREAQRQEVLSPPAFPPPAMSLGPAGPPPTGGPPPAATCLSPPTPRSSLPPSHHPGTCAFIPVPAASVLPLAPTGSPVSSPQRPPRPRDATSQEPLGLSGLPLPASLPPRGNSSRACYCLFMALTVVTGTQPDQCKVQVRPGTDPRGPVSPGAGWGDMGGAASKVLPGGAWGSVLSFLKSKELTLLSVSVSVCVSLSLCVCLSLCFSISL